MDHILINNPNEENKIISDKMTEQLESIVKNKSMAEKGNAKNKEKQLYHGYIFMHNILDSRTLEDLEKMMMV